MAEDLYANMEIAPRKVKDMLARGEKLFFVDVRERWEYDISHIEGSVLIPLREIPGRAFLPPRDEKHGRRSMAALSRRGRSPVDGRWN